jgi:hypothetical protein
MSEGFDNTWNECAIPGCRGPREGGARFCPPCLRESILSQEKYEREAHKAISALFVTPDPPAPEPKPVPFRKVEPGDRITTLPAAAETPSDGLGLRRLVAMLAALVERQTADAFEDAPKQDPDTLVPPALDEPPPTDYRTPADGYGKAEPYRPIHSTSPVFDRRAVASRELHSSHLLELGPMCVGTISVACPGRFVCADVHGFRVWLPGALTLGECETLAVRSIQHMGCVIYGDFGKGSGGAPGSHFLRLREVKDSRGLVIRLQHHCDLLFQVENVSQFNTLRVGVVLDLTGYDRPPPSKYDPLAYNTHLGWR